MFIVGFLGWWYGAGWRSQLGRTGERLLRVFDYFSLDLLVKTWFSPFRQIGTEQARGGLSEQFRAFLDQLVSRVIGGVVRTIMMIVGICALVLSAVIGVLMTIVWVVAPLLPIASIVVFATGWVPYAGI